MRLAIFKFHDSEIIGAAALCVGMGQGVAKLLELG